MSVLLKQVRLSRKVDTGTLQTTCWIDGWKKFKVGDRITLKEEPNIWWTVDGISDTTTEKSLLPHGTFGSLRGKESVYG